MLKAGRKATGSSERKALAARSDSKSCFDADDLGRLQTRTVDKRMTVPVGTTVTGLLRTECYRSGSLVE